MMMMMMIMMKIDGIYIVAEYFYLKVYCDEYNLAEQ